MVEKKLLIRLPEEQHKALKVKAAEVERGMADIARTLFDLWLNGDIELPEETQHSKIGSKKETR